MEMTTMLQGYKDLVIERDKKIEEVTKEITDEYNKKLADHKKSMHQELDSQIRGLV
jgi:hypothetical protein